MEHPMAFTLAEMIDKFEMYVMQRQIGIAEHLANEFLNDSSTSPLKESGYAILCIILPYFEMMEQFDTGYSSKNRSKQCFTNGFRDVYRCTQLSDPEIGLIYDWVRCGMFHFGMTKSKTELSRHFPAGFQLNNGTIQINPGRVVAEVKAHFQQYMSWLRSPIPTGIPENFQHKCEELGLDQVPPEAEQSTTPATLAPFHRG
jgi:hypothetical protein